MATEFSPQSFSIEKHAQGRWDTRVLTLRSPWLRSMASYLSYKRRGVDRLAQKAKAPGFICDAGAGKGAYDHWFLGRRPSASVIAVDWSVYALRSIRPPKQGRILRVCADVQNLPFKSGSVVALFSIDTLGHVPHIGAALDEFNRICKINAPLFLHSECADYRMRWPDKRLIAILGKDAPAEDDGHISLHNAEQLYAWYSRRFTVQSFINPAGYLGWLIGYPEKYHGAFAEAGLGGLARMTATAAWLKGVWPMKICLRLINALTNHSEVFFGLRGGGSCFAELKRP
jgi:ubiquinone/menaquinone biosynthesis C-methylase UbiE